MNEMYDETLNNLKTRKPVTKPSTVASPAEKECLEKLKTKEAEVVDLTVRAP